MIRELCIFLKMYFNITILNRWHLKHDKWHVRQETGKGVGGRWIFSLAITVWEGGYYESMFTWDEWLSLLMIHKAGFRTAPAKPGLSNVENCHRLFWKVEGFPGQINSGHHSQNSWRHFSRNSITLILFFFFKFLETQSK